jgi:hypothetical protein
MVSERISDMTRKVTIGLIAAAVVSGSSAVRADSDLYWCHSGNYLTYDYRAALHRAGTSHELKIIRFGPDMKAPSMTTVSIPDGQVHRLECQPDELMVIQYEDRPVQGYVKRTIQLAKPGSAVVTSSGTIPDIVALNGPEPMWLMSQRDPSGMPARSVDLRQNRYTLVFERTPKERCRMDLKVLLRAPKGGGSDFIVAQTVVPTECGE